MHISKSLLIFCVLKRSVLPLELIKLITEQTIPTVSICEAGYIVDESLFVDEGKTKHSSATSIVSTVHGTLTLQKGKILLSKNNPTCSTQNKLQLFIEKSNLLPVKTMRYIGFDVIAFLTKCGTLIIWNIHTQPHIIGKQIEKIVNNVICINNDKFIIHWNNYFDECQAAYGFKLVKYVIKFPISVNTGTFFSDVGCQMVYRNNSFYFDVETIESDQIILNNIVIIGRGSDFVLGAEFYFFLTADRKFWKWQYGSDRATYVLSCVSDICFLNNQIILVSYGEVYVCNDSTNFILEKILHI